MIQTPSVESAPLLKAAARRDLAAVNRLLAAGAKVDAVDANGWTALHHAVGYGQTHLSDVPDDRKPNRAVVDALLKAGAPLDARAKDGCTPLMTALMAMHEDAARQLIEAGADLRPVDRFGGSALTMALWERRCSQDLAQLLLKRGAPVNLWDALWLGDDARAAKLVETVDPKASGPNGFTYLHLAALLSKAAIAARLLKRGADIRARTEDGATPLHLACGGIPHRMIQGYAWYGPRDGREALVKLLLTAGANPADKGGLFESPREWARRMERPELVRLLAPPPRHR